MWYDAPGARAAARAAQSPDDETVYYIILYYIICLLYYIVLCYIILYYIILYCMIVSYSVVLCCIVLHCIVLYCIVLYSVFVDKNHYQTRQNERCYHLTVVSWGCVSLNCFVAYCHVFLTCSCWSFVALFGRGDVRLETLIELKVLKSSFSGLSSFWN